LTISFVSLMTSVSAQQGLTVVEIWNNAMSVVDLAVSRDGSSIAVVNSTGLYFFDSHNPVARWWYLNGTTSEKFMSVAISANGHYVIVGNNTIGSIYYFDGGNFRTGLQSAGSWKWVSKHFVGDVERRTIDISDDGQFVVVGGTGDKVYYFFGCTSRVGIGNPWDWISEQQSGFIHAVDISPDGKYVAAGGLGSGVVFFADANVAGVSPRVPNWKSASNIFVVDVAVSHDGYAVAVAAADVSNPDTTLHYWANAKSLTGNPLNTWNRTILFGCVDASGDGDRVVAGTGMMIGSLHFWNDAKTLVGKDIAETWIRLPDELVFDVGTSDDGNIIAAVVPFTAVPYHAAGEPLFSNGPVGPGKVYFYTAAGDLFGNFTTSSGVNKLSMSGSGGITAVGGDGLRSLYVFEIPMAVGGEVIPVMGGGQFVSILLPLVLLAGAGCSLFLRKRRVQ